MRYCSIEDCNRKYRANNYCSKHNQQLRIHGKIYTSVYRGEPIKRFEQKINKTDTCWYWTGGILLGYGYFWYNNKTLKAHRFSYELYKEKIPYGLTIDHLCEIKKCVNPDHLEAVTIQENLKRRDISVRKRKGLL